MASTTIQVERTALERNREWQYAFKRGWYLEVIGDFLKVCKPWKNMTYGFTARTASGAMEKVKDWEKR